MLPLVSTFPEATAAGERSRSSDDHGERTMRPVFPFLVSLFEDSLMFGGTMADQLRPMWADLDPWSPVPDEKPRHLWAAFARDEDSEGEGENSEEEEDDEDEEDDVEDEDLDEDLDDDFDDDLDDDFDDLDDEDLDDDFDDFDDDEDDEDDDDEDDDEEDEVDEG